MLYAVCCIYDKEKGAITPDMALQLSKAKLKLLL